VATAPIQPLAWEPPYAAGAAQEIPTTTTTTKKKKPIPIRKWSKGSSCCGSAERNLTSIHGEAGMIPVLIAMSCDVACRCGSDLALLWLWCTPTATALIRPLAWEPPYAASEALKRQKLKIKKRKENGQKTGQ